MIKIEALHHVSIPVANLERAKRFYEDMLGLTERDDRPDFDFEGAWYDLGGGRQLHLIVHPNPNTSTFRTDKLVDSRDIHFALRVSSYHETCAFLRSRGYHPEADDPLKRTRESPDNKTPWQQIYVMDPDRNVIELNAERPQS